MIFRTPCGDFALHLYHYITVLVPQVTSIYCMNSRTTFSCRMLLVNVLLIPWKFRGRKKKVRENITANSRQFEKKPKELQNELQAFNRERSLVY